MGACGPRAGQAGAGLVDRVELAGKNLYCSFCFQHAISESPADEEEQWSDDFVSICSWDEKGTIFTMAPGRSL